MKVFTLLGLAFFGVSAASAAEIRYRTLQEVRMANPLQLMCKSSNNGREMNVSFRFGFGFPDTLSIVAIWPNEAMWVQEVKNDPNYPVWGRDYGGPADAVIYTGNSIPTHEWATVKIEQGTSGRFKVTFLYLHRVTGKRLEFTEQRCYATNFTRTLE